MPSQQALNVIASCELTRDMVVSAMIARDQSDRRSTIPAYIGNTMTRAMERCYLYGSQENSVGDLSKSDRENFILLCMGAGGVFVAAKTPEIFLATFGQYLDRIVRQRAQFLEDLAKRAQQTIAA